MKHQIGNSSVEVISGDICDSKCEVIVSSDDSRLSQGGGVSLSIARAGGGSIAEQIRHLIPVELGDVAVTTAGKLPQKYVFHAVTIDLENSRVIDEELEDFIVRNSVRRCIRLMATFNLSSIAFPLIGAGVAGISPQRAMRRLLEMLREELGKVNRGLLVELWLYDEPVDVAEEIFGEISGNAGQGKCLPSTEYVLSTATDNMGLGVATGGVATAGVCAAAAGASALMPVAALAGGVVWGIKKLFDKRSAKSVAPQSAEIATGETATVSQISVSSGEIPQSESECPVDGSVREVFVSYSRKDAGDADWVCSVLSAAGISYWRDVDGLYSGQNFKGVIVRAIRAAHTVFFLSSKDSNASENVRGEIGAALHLRKHVIPIRLDDSEYHDDLLLDILNLDSIVISDLGKKKAAEKMKSSVLLNRRRASARQLDGGLIKS